MGGSAGILCAFKALVENSAQDAGAEVRPIHALLCLAENSVGPEATRPDDVHVFYSGEFCVVRVCCSNSKGSVCLCLCLYLFVSVSLSLAF